MQRSSARGQVETRAPQQFEATVAAGLEEILCDELERFGTRLRIATVERGPIAGAVRFDYTGDLRSLLKLRTALAVFLIRSFPVPRPRALLGDEHLRTLIATIGQVQALHPPSSFATLHVSAAGTETAVMTRLRDEIQRHTRLSDAPEEGDMLLRLRRDPEYDGWEVLVRLTPRPLATRSWRICNLEGALNATVACAMMRLTLPSEHDQVLNLACGSGTLLIERLSLAPVRQAIGCDTNRTALECAQRNVEAAGFADRIVLHPWDARKLPLPNQSVDVICADFPFGHLVGSHRENLDLYPAIFKEATRVARQAARFVLITHEVRLTEELIADHDDWGTDGVVRITLGGLHPRIYLLRRR